LHFMEGPLEKTLQKLPHAVLRVIADKPPGFRGLLRQRMSLFPGLRRVKLRGFRG
jgi:hypothetical protein